MNTLIPGVYADSKVRCDNCGHEATGREMRPIDNANERLFAGEEVPAGACPKCGCCAYLTEERLWFAKPRRLEAFNAGRPDDPWVEHADYPREDWAYEAANGDTVLGYHEWVAHRRESEEE